MEREKIERVARKIARVHADEPDGTVRAVVDGMEWRINSVWHSPDELPRIGSYVVALYEDEYIYFGKVKDYCNSVPVKTWAYIDDLLPELHEE